MMKSNNIQSIINEFCGQKCKLKLLNGDVITGTLSKMEQISTNQQTVQVIEAEQTESKAILITQIEALGLA